MTRNRTWNCLAGPAVPPSTDQPPEMVPSDTSSGGQIVGVRVHQNGILHAQVLVARAELDQFLAGLVQTLPESLQSVVHIDLVPLQAGGFGPTAPDAIPDGEPG